MMKTFRKTPDWQIVGRKVLRNASASGFVQFACLAAFVVLLLGIVHFAFSAANGLTSAGIPSLRDAQLPIPPPYLNPKPTISIYKPLQFVDYHLSAKNRLLILLNLLEDDTDIDRLLNNMQTWAQWFQPCRAPAGHTRVIDLMFYSPHLLSDASISLITGFLDDHPKVQSCFGEISFRFANLYPEQDTHSSVSTELFHQFMIHQRTERPYTHFFSMTPDVLPFRPFWLDLLLDQLEEPYGFWVKGSASVSTTIGGDALYPHIGANAIYIYDSETGIKNFVHQSKYYCKSAVDSATGAPRHSLEMSLYSYALEQRREKLHKFAFSEFILDNPSYSYKQLVTDHPYTFFVHGRNWVSLVKPLDPTLHPTLPKRFATHSHVVMTPRVSSPSSPLIPAAAQAWLEKWQLSAKQETPKYIQCRVNGDAGLGNQFWEMMHCAFSAAISNRVMVYMYGAKIKPFLDVPIEFIDPKSLPAVTHGLVEKATYYTCSNLHALFGESEHVQVSLSPAQSHMFAVGYYLYMNPYYANTMRELFGSSPYHIMANFLFRPRSDIASKIDAYVEQKLRPYKTIGIHIRYHPSVPHNEMYFIGTAEEHAQAFITCIEPWVEELSKSGEEWRIYLATDSSVVRSHFVKEYGADRILGIGFDTPPDSGNDEALVTDLWTLKETDYFAGTFYSSLSAFVATMRPPGVPTRYVLRKGQCIMTTQGESFWPDQELLELYPGFEYVIKQARDQGCYNEVVDSQFGLDWSRG